MKLDIATIKLWQKKQSINPSIYHTGNKGKWQYSKNESMDKYFQHLIAIGMICILRISHTNFGFGELWKKSFEKTQDQVRDRWG